MQIKKKRMITKITMTDQQMLVSFFVIKKASSQPLQVIIDHLQPTETKRESI
jgi:hypothetical protein